jgi:hypothetical protein
MRRLFVVLLFTLLVLPFAAVAQDQPLAWELNATSYLDLKDLGFRFYYPSGWVYDTSNGNGVQLADTQANLNAQIDGDDNTQPNGLSIVIRGIPLTALSDLGTNPTLDTIADYVVKIGGLTEIQRVEVPVITRRSISIFATTNTDRAGIASIWVQNGFLILASLGGQDTQSINDLAYTWYVTLSSIAPIDPLPLSTDLLSDESSHFTINYPANWTPEPDQPSTVYELADDIGKGVNDVKGSVFTFSDAALSDLQLPEDATLDDVIAKVKPAFDLDDTVRREEFVFLDQPAVTLSGEPTPTSKGAGHGLIVTIGLVKGHAIILVLVTPTVDAVATLMPTWVSMLSSVTSTETPP